MTPISPRRSKGSTLKTTWTAKKRGGWTDSRSLRQSQPNKLAAKPDLSLEALTRTASE